MTVTALKKRVANKCPLYSEIDKKLPNIYYSQEIRNLLPFRLTAKNSQFISIHNKRLGYFNPYASERTWQTGLKNGHTDTEVFSLVNGFKKVAAYTKRGTRINNYEPLGNHDGLVIDMDNSVFPGTLRLVDYLKINNLPIPHIISQTGPYSYHLVYKFNLDAGLACISKEDSLYLGLMLSKVSFNQLEAGNTAKDNIDKLDNTYFKIDKNYINQDPSCHKWRVPSTPKIKDTKFGKEIYVCRGWVNMEPVRISQYQLRAKAGCYEFYGPEYKAEFHWHDGSYIDGLEDIALSDTKPHKLPTRIKAVIAPTVVVATEASLTSKEKVKLVAEGGFWTETTKDFKEEIEKVLPKRYAKRYSEWFSENLTFLKQGKCAISQVRLGQELDITQATISKHLKLLINAGILSTNHFYIKDKSPKVYRLGQVMINRIYTIDTTYEIGKEYGAGTTNDQFLSDVRYLYSAGIEKDEIVTLLDIKMQQKSKSKRRKTREIEKAVDRWSENCSYKTPPLPLLDFDELNRKVIGIQYEQQIYRFPRRDRVRPESQ